MVARNCPRRNLDILAVKILVEWAHPAGRSSIDTATPDATLKTHEPAVPFKPISCVSDRVRRWRTTARLQVPSRRRFASVGQRIGDHVGNRNADGESWKTNRRIDAGRS